MLLSLLKCLYLFLKIEFVDRFFSSGIVPPCTVIDSFSRFRNCSRYFVRFLCLNFNICGVWG